MCSRAVIVDRLIDIDVHFGVSDTSPIQNFGVSVQFWPTLTLLSDTEQGCAFINADIAKTVTFKLLLESTILMMVSV